MRETDKSVNRENECSRRYIFQEFLKSRRDKEACIRFRFGQPNFARRVRVSHENIPAISFNLQVYSKTEFKYFCQPERAHSVSSLFARIKSRARFYRKIPIKRGERHSTYLVSRFVVASIFSLSLSSSKERRSLFLLFLCHRRRMTATSAAN